MRNLRAVPQVPLITISSQLHPTANPPVERHWTFSLSPPSLPHIIAIILSFISPFQPSDLLKFFILHSSHPGGLFFLGRSISPDP